MKRWLQTLVTLTAIFVLSAAHATAPSQKNMIFILVDDLRFDGMGFLTPEIKTPHIDDLAAGGAYFPDAVVTSSLCSPSRATILTGMTARNHGIVDNRNSTEEGLRFFPEYLQQAGYQTGFFGKWHMGQHADNPRPGFDRWVSFAGQGSYNPTDNIPQELLDKGVLNQINVDGKHVPQKGYITDELTDYAMNWLEGRDTSKPFFLYLSHKAVHSQPIPAERHEGMYDGTDFKLPATSVNTEELRKNKPMWVYNQRNSWHGLDFFNASDQTMPDYLRETYASLASVDDSVGRIVKWLEDNQLAEETVVVFFSDNGYLIGDHGLVDKRNAYEGSVRVPLLVWAPGMVKAGSVMPKLVRNLDLAPTFLDIAGVPSPEQFEGQSFLPLATGDVAVEDWESPDFIYEYFWEWSVPMNPTTFAIRRGDYKYIQYYGIWDTEELYNLKEDPEERHNLFFDMSKRAMVQELRVALYEHLANSSGQHMLPYSARLAEGINLRDRNGTKSAPFPEQWLTDPNRPDRYMGYFEDTPLKLQKQKEGKPYLPFMEHLKD